MRRHWTAMLLAALGAMGSVRAQEQDEFLRLPLRVSSVAGRSIVIDRGTRDRVEIGDRVRLSPRAGGTYAGVVAEIDERNAVVHLDDPAFTPPPGTRGEVLVPRARVQPDEPEQPEDPVAEPPPAEPTEPPRWQERGDGWEPGMPLLAKVEPVRPEERPSRVTGRVWALGDLVRVPDTGVDDRGGNSTWRLGAAIDMDNPFGYGGALRFDGEINRWTRRNDDTDTDVLVRQLAYRHGGTRFAPTQWQIGRFVQSVMPEFGILDGIEWVRRTPDGHRFGASIGYLPELDNELRTGDDLQFAGFFHWTADDLERLTVDVGYQKTFHDAKADRDLFVLKSRWIPDDEWDLIGTVWLDYYYGRDDLKGNGLSVSQAFFAATRRYDDGSGYDVTYRRYEFPETLRYEFEPFYPQDLADDQVDRLAIGGWTGARGARRTHGELSGWVDESDSGGAAELGFGFPDVFFERDELDVTVFASLGSYTNAIGVRADLGRATDNGRWDVLYEFSNQHIHYRDNDADDLHQHRVRGSHSFFLGSRWTVQLHADALLFDDDFSWAVGFHVQKSF